MTFALRRRSLPSILSISFIAGVSRRSLADDSCTTVPDYPTVKRPSPQVHAEVSSEPELGVAFRCHGMQDEFLRSPITPLGSHYLLIHFDVPALSEEGYTLQVGGHVARPMTIPLSTSKSRQVVTQAVTMECAGTGRRLLSPRPVYVPWESECIGTYQWIGTPLAPILQEAGILGSAVEVLFTGWDRGVDQGVEHAFERSLPLEDALHPEVMLGWAANGQPLLPQHGFPLRLIVPSWYGMASVKWLRAITVLSQPFQGIQQTKAYRYRQSPDELGSPVREKRVMSLMMPPGLPDLLSRYRFVSAGAQTLQGAAWSGFGSIVSVDVSTDGGSSWQNAALSPVSDDPFAWTFWQAEWQAAKADMATLLCRATDSAGNVQPSTPQEVWNLDGHGVNCVRSVNAIVQKGVGSSGDAVPSVPRVALSGATPPPATS